MKVKKTYQHKIKDPNKGKALSLNKTVRQWRKCVNFYLHRLREETKLKEIYKESKQNYNLPTALIQTARDFAKEQVESYEENEDNSNYPHFDNFIPVRFDKRTIYFQKMNNHFEVWANIATVNGRVKVPVVGRNLEKLIDEFKSAQLRFDGNDFYLNVVFEEEKNISKEEDFDVFIGVDLGIKNIATVIAQNKNGEILDSKFFSSGELQEKRRRYKELRRNLGENKCWSKIKETKNDESNYIKDKNHKISKKIIEFAEKNDADVIVMEKLDNIREHIDHSKEMSWKLHNWSFDQLQELLKYKAHDREIAFRRVKPHHTSSVCVNCLGVVERVSQSKAVCESCQTEINADFLGAVNVVRRLFSYMLKGLGDRGYRPEQGSDELEGDTSPVLNHSKKIVSQLRVS